MFKIIILTTLIISSYSAYASCTYNGKSYPEGTVIGPYICTNSKWELKGR